LVGQQDFHAFRLVGDFAHHTGDILALIADTLTPQSIDDIGELQFD